MLHPAPVTSRPLHIALGKLLEVVDATATKPSYIVVSFPNTSYRIHLHPQGAIRTELGKRIEGVIQADARRVDKVGSGGRYVEPVFGRPRRVQGSIVAKDDKANTITVHAGVPIVCRLTDARQRADQFEPGDFVSFDVLRGATFTESV
ncbi:MAG: hypothetical protein EA378_11615 [Phycisphaerales bacterium]|nr:MAG: hypothetical protein EA378_11615 [Phycisphaerales bacterium]